MIKIIIGYGVGVLFGLGMLLSGMFNPYKVLNFFDIQGQFDPSLIFVMGGALCITIIGYHIVKRKEKPLFEKGFHIPNHNMITMRLIGGSMIFGLGWGIVGFCPGSALPLVGTGNMQAILFIIMVCVGILLTRLVTIKK